MAAAIAVAMIAGGTLLTLKAHREREWAHGGDDLAVTTDVRLADRQTFDAVTAALGVPAGRSMGLVKPQAVVARLTWSGSTAPDGDFLIVALDRRVSPARVLVGDSGWTPIETGGPAPGVLRGSSWVSSYGEVLAQHYDWLAGVRRFTASPAVNTPVRSSGAVTAWFTLPEDTPEFTDASDVIIGLIYVAGPSQGADAIEDYVRWARRVAG